MKERYLLVLVKDRIRCTSFPVSRQVGNFPIVSLMNLEILTVLIVLNGS